MTISFILDDNTVLCICADDPICDGYMNVWIEDELEN